MWRLAVVFLALALAACAQKPLAPDQVAAIRTIGVVSAIGDTFHQASIGITVFGNDEKATSIDAWGIDPFVVDRVGGLLSRRYDVRPVTHAKGAFAEDKIFYPYEGGLFGDKRRPIEDVARDELQHHGLDAYIVLTKSYARYGMTNQSVRALGAVTRTSLVGKDSYLHALYWLTVIDGRTFKIIGDVKAPGVVQRTTVQTLAMQPAVIAGPSLGTDAVFATQPLSSMPAATLASLKQDLQDLLVRSFPLALREVKLLDP